MIQKPKHSLGVVLILLMYLTGFVIMFLSASIMYRFGSQYEGIELTVLTTVTLIIFIVGIFYTERNTYTEKGDCYDNRDNKMDNLTCDIKRYNFPLVGVVSILSMFLAIILAFKGVISGMWD